MPNKKKTMQKQIVSLTIKELELVKQDSEKTGLSISEIVRRLIDKFYMEKENNSISV
jgi:Ribbon-helix-helix protein, copG family